MCGTCGCGNGAVRLDVGAPAHDHDHSHEHGHDHAHDHAHDHDHDHDHDHEHAHGHAHDPAHGHDAGSADTGGAQAREVRRLQVEIDLLQKNNEYAAANRARFARAGVQALNLVSSPGSGKTTLLVKTIEALRGRRSVAVIEGDQETALDAERIRATGVPAVQINTGKGCHLDAHMVGHACDRLALAAHSLLLIENVGNLVCPAAFDLGEAAKVVVLSVTEGEDKPLKYPDMFRASALMLLNKCDLLPHLSYRREFAEQCARRVNPALEIIAVSAQTGEGMERWLEWIERRRPPGG